MYRIFTKLFAEQIVRNAYRGIFGREADPAGQKAHVAALKRHGKLDVLLGDMVKSAEAQQRQVVLASDAWAGTIDAAVFHGQMPAERKAQVSRQLADGANLRDLFAGLVESERDVIRPDRAEHYVRVAFQSLLNREPEADAMAAYVNLLLRTQDLSILLSEIGSSEEHFRLCLRAEAPSEWLVRCIFRAVFGREPEEDALFAYGSLVRDENGAERTIEEIAHSEENWRGLLRRHSPALMEQVFSGLIGRQPDAAERQRYSEVFANSQSWERFVDHLSRSRELRERILRRALPT